MIQPILIPCNIVQWIDTNTLVSVIGIIVTLLAIFGVTITFPLTRKWRKEQLDNIPDDFSSHYPNENYIQPYFTFVKSGEANQSKQLLNDYFLKKVFIKNTTEPKLFCLLGDTGTGKTAALVHLYADYIHSHSAKSPYQIKILSLRNNSVFERINQIEEKKRCILLLDAMDENPMAQDPNRRAQFNTKINESCQNFAFVVISCRPQFFSDEASESNQINIRRGEEDDPEKYTRLRLSPFDETQIKAFLDKVFTSESENEKRHKAEEIVNKHALIAIRPLVLTHIRDIVESNREINTTLDFHDIIVKKQIQRELKKASLDNHDVQLWWDITSEVAGYIYQQTNGTANELSISKEEIQDICNKFNHIEFEDFLASLNIASSPTNNDIIINPNQFQQRSLLTRTGDRYHFSHKSYYEYFMAYRFILYPEEIGHINGMDFALQLYNEILNNYKEKRQISFADLSQLPKEKIALSLNEIGRDLYRLYYYNEAETKLQEALNIYRQLYKQYPDVFQSDLVTALTDLADLHRDVQNFHVATVAEEEYNEALNICEHLVKQNKDKHLPLYARILNNLAILHKRLFNTPKAEAEYKKALTAYQQLAEQKPDEYLPDVAMTLTNLANLHSKSSLFNTHIIEAAEKEYFEALKIYNYMEEQGFDIPLYNISKLLNGLAKLHKTTDKYDYAEEELEIALSIQNELAEEDPDAYLTDVAGTLYNIALLLLDRKKFSAAEDAAQESLEKYRIMAEKIPAKFDNYVKKGEDLLKRIQRMKESAE